MKTGIELIAQERAEQIEKHGRTVEYDLIQNREYQLSTAAALLARQEEMDNLEISVLRPEHWVFKLWVRMCHKSYKERLIIAGALIAAEIDRLQNAKP